MRDIDQLSEQEKSDLVLDILDKKSGNSALEWKDIVRDYELNCSPETLRKAGVGVKLAQDAGMCFPESCSEDCEITDDNKQDLGEFAGYGERQKLYDLRKEIKKDLREQSRSEMLREMIQNAIKELPPINVYLERKTVYNPRKKELVIGLGDMHFGADWEVKGLYDEILNKYNEDVFLRRMDQLGSEICGIAKVHEPGVLTVMLVGDFLDGVLRASQLTRLQFGVVESAMYLSEHLAHWLAELANNTGIPVRVYAVRGNHGEIRPLGSKAGQFPEENMERVVMHYLHARFAFSPYVKVEDDDAPMTRMVDVCGQKILMLHGQGGDIEKIARDHQLLYNTPIDMFICGHLHKSQTFTAGVGNGNVLIERVPSICGMDPFAQSKGYGSKPGATAILFEEGYGRRCVYPIVLE